MFLYPRTHVVSLGNGKYLGKRVGRKKRKMGMGHMLITPAFVQER